MQIVSPRVPGKEDAEDELVRVAQIAIAIALLAIALYGRVDFCFVVCLASQTACVSYGQSYYVIIFRVFSLFVAHAVVLTIAHVEGIPTVF